MGLFNWTLFGSKPDPVSEAVRNAYDLGYAAGERDGAIKALETTADAIDRGLAAAEIPEGSQVRELLLGMRRTNKEIAAELARQS